jgi:hypothetical protein
MTHVTQSPTAEFPNRLLCHEHQTLPTLLAAGDAGRNLCVTPFLPVNLNEEVWSPDPSPPSLPVASQVTISPLPASFRPSTSVIGFQLVLWPNPGEKWQVGRHQALGEPLCHAIGGSSIPGQALQRGQPPRYGLWSRLLEKKGNLGREGMAEMRNSDSTTGATKAGCQEDMAHTGPPVNIH